MNSFFLIIVFLAHSWSSLIYGAVTLPKVIEENAVVTIERTLGAIAVGDSQIIVTPLKKEKIVLTPWQTSGKSRQEKFGDMIASKRFDLDKLGRIEGITGLAVVGDKVLVLDGFQMMTFVLNLAEMNMLAKHSIVLDRIRPAADSRGEATKLEIAKTRNLMRQRLKQSLKPALVGMANYYSREKMQESPTFLVATRLKNFPLVLMACDKNQLSRCTFTRQCFVEGSKVKTADLGGIGYDPEKKNLYFADTTQQNIEVLKISSCYHVRRRGLIGLPEKIYAMTNLTVGPAGQLWLTTNRPDNYFNSSAFQFEIPNF